MGVAPQVEAEMAVVLGRVFGLRLGAQHHLVDEDLVFRAVDARQDAVEQRRLQRALLRQLQADRGQHLAQRAHLLQRGLVVDPVDEAAAGLLESLRGATLARIMNSSMSRCASSRSGTKHAIHGAVGLEHDLALGQVEEERLAHVARSSRRRRRPRAGFRTGSRSGAVVLVGRPSMAAWACW